MVNTLPTSRVGPIAIVPHYRDKESAIQNGWRVEIPRRIAGKRIQKFFQDEGNAIIFAQEKYIAFQSSGAVAFEDLEKPADGGALTVSKVIDLYLKSRKETAGYRTLNNHLQKFSRRFGGLEPDVVPARSVKRWLDEELTDYEPRTRYGIFTSCAQLWKWAIRYDYANTPLFTKVEPPSKGDSEIHILTPRQMALAIKHAPHPYVLSWILLGGFAGLRSCEIKRMIWKDVKEQIHIRREVIKKTRGIKERYVTRRETLDRFLVVGDEEAEVVPVSEQTFHHHTKALAVKIGLGGKWLKNALRDSFASYMLAECEDAQKVATQLGHTTTQMVHQSYAKAAKKADAAEFWNLTPEIVAAVE